MSMNKSTDKQAVPTYRIHPGIGIARLGDSPTKFCISPEKPTGLPLACDAQGNPLFSPDGQSEVTITQFKDGQGRIKRQAARFQLYVYDNDSTEGRPLKLGDKIQGGGNEGILVDIEWRVYLANKKAVWYEFDALQGEHGYDANHPRRNADITEPEARQQLIIDPGGQVVNVSDRRQANFSRDNLDNKDVYAPTFPPELLPNSINTLGELKTDNAGRLLVLGGHGKSGTVKRGLGHPRIDTYANNDGWFDDTSDGVVTARLVMYSQQVERQRFIDVEYPAWVVVGYPAYVPQILDIVTADDVIYDLAIREFAYRTDIYGKAGTFDNPEKIDTSDPDALRHWKRYRLTWNLQYKPWFYRDIWPILFRADEFTYLTNILKESNLPHNQTGRGNIDPDKLSVPPKIMDKPLKRQLKNLINKYRDGGLWAEFLERQFHLWDEKLKKEPYNLQPNQGFLSKLETQNNWNKLKDIALTFVRSIECLAHIEHKSDTDPIQYLQSWQKLYRQVQAEPETSDLKKHYTSAVTLLENQINELINERDPVNRKLSRRPNEDEKEDFRPNLSQCLQEFHTGKLLEDAFEKAKTDCTYDRFRKERKFLYDIMRQPDEENRFRLGGAPKNRTSNLPLMPLLAGDNPFNNVAPSKFLRMTDYQLHILRQWAEGKFYNEIDEGWVKPDEIDVFHPYKNWVNKTGRDLDQGVLMNVLGGAFCPGGEVGWLIRNPAIYKEPYRLKADPDFSNFPQTAAQANQRGLPAQDYTSSVDTNLSQDSNFDQGLQPGDLTKQIALPWQSDFNECTTHKINITYKDWNLLNPDSGNDTWLEREQQVWETLWWPAHRPLQAYEVVGFDGGQPQYKYLNWSRGVPQTNAGNLKMVTEWSRLGFIIRNPYLPLPAREEDKASPDKKYISVERKEDL
ncbi:3-isopropylmalate dehydrogenase [Cylindrospermum sp. NIES-4074]|nr:3-isopropylmalate dehydrogenase [Cylindrospermum sp. NIES-4074]